MDIITTSRMGEIHRYTDFEFENLEPRNVDVWCSPGYDDQPVHRYAVIYMHDGQNLYDLTSAYGGMDWGIDEAISGLMQSHAIPGAIVVGIWNSSQRYRDYMPQKPLEAPAGGALRNNFTQEYGGLPLSDEYLKFLVEELKPFIDRNYRSLPDRDHTFVMGSSMGSLISLYALEEYPHIFGATGCLSTHWPIGDNILVEYLGEHLPEPGSHRLYFDYGTATLDAEYEPYQNRMDAWLQQAGFQLGKNWITQKFEGAEHNEAAWRARVHIPLKFLLT
jgi:predicted alpha/beta superfamily hydrolase